MSDVSILGKKWIDIVFEGRNKSYGAYQLRQENSRTTLTAFAFGILFVGSLCGGGFLLSSFGEKPDIPLLPDLPKITTVDASRIEPPKRKIAEKVVAPVEKKKIEKKDLVNAVIVKGTDDPDDVNTNKNPNTTTASTPTTEGTLTDAPGVDSPGTPSGTNTTSTVPLGPYRKGALDVQPKFPGGIEKFYNYIGNNFKKSESETGAKLTVLVSFVIEKDGSITDIKVLQNPGEGLDKEAIRVLKSLKTKWEPGIKDGQKVRTIYTLPITVLR